MSKSIAIDLKAVPSTPCGVSSQSHSPQSRISPIYFHGDKEIEMRRFVSVINSMPGCEIIKLEGDILHVVCRRFFVFKDDLECVWSEVDQVMHVRSVARWPITDFGANRNRLEKIRLMFDKGYLF